MTHRESAPHPPWYDPSMPGREECVSCCLLVRHARETPEREFIRFESGERWTFRQTLELTRRTAAALHRRGVGCGDNVLVWLPNGATIIRAWFATNYLGAVFIPLNTSYRGALLHHAITESAARLMIVHADLAPRLSEIGPTQLERLLIVGPESGDSTPPVPAERDALDCPDEPPAMVEVERWDLQMVIFTSGTTGPSKGVACSYLQMYRVGCTTYGYLEPSDRIMVDLPMFHVGGVSPIICALKAGASVALYDSFSTDMFWERVRETGATTTSGLVGSMAAFLAKRPARADDADNTLRMVVLGPLTTQAMELARRHAFHYMSGFNMTEVSTPLVTDVNTPVRGSCGRPRSGCECRVVDEHDIEVAPGAPGELVVRTDLPWEMCLGYHNRPEATARAWRNGWFHTGDLVYRDASGNFFFVDRLKDAIRRRGENISSIEVETEVYSYPGVAEAAALGVPSEHGEEEVLIAVVAKPDAAIRPAELIEHLTPRMPHYMVPRYVRLMDALPKTLTNKIQKARLRAEGVTPQCWDREAAGIHIRKSRLGS